MGNLNNKEQKEKKKETKVNIKEIIKKNKKLSLGILIGAITIVILVIIGVFIASREESNDENNIGKGNKPQGEVIISNEETIEDEYSFTKEDAINVIKELYNSDNYIFTAKAREDNMYVVTVTNPDTNTADVYEVDPNDGTFKYISDIRED